MIERLEPKEVEGIKVIYKLGESRMETYSPSIKITQEPNLKEVVAKVNEIADKLNELERKEPKTTTEEWNEHFDRLHAAMVRAQERRKK